LLSELRLPAIKLMWAALAARADKEGWPGARFLAALAEHEVADRGRCRIERHLASARSPAGKTFDTFDFNAVPMVSKAQVMALAAEGTSTPMTHGLPSAHYVSTALLTRAGRNRSSGRRIPAGSLEGLVINRLRAFLADPTAILDPLDDEAQSGLGQNKLIECGRQLAEELGAQVPTEAKITLMKLL
jgi:hypothetical protein